MVKQSGQTEWSNRGPREQGARARPRPASGLKPDLKEAVEVEGARTEPPCTRHAW